MIPFATLRAGLIWREAHAVGPCSFWFYTSIENTDNDLQRRTWEPQR